MLVLCASCTPVWRAGGKHGARYVPFDRIARCDLADLVVTDCTHPEADTLSHHNGNNNPAGLPPSDCSTGLVLNALTAFKDSDPTQILDRAAITTNHFDIDSFLSVFTYLNPDLAVLHSSVLRQAARLGDFRELHLSPDATAEARADGASTSEEADIALKLCCWLNSVERERFSPPYEDKDSAEKFGFCLPAFSEVLLDAHRFESVWGAEYRSVRSDLAVLQSGATSTSYHPDIGLAVLRLPHRLHYYAAFSHTVGYDYVLTLYPGNGCELEAKYTQFVQLHSRPVQPRLDLRPLARTLNALETTAHADSSGDVIWAASAPTDSGPILRRDSAGTPLSKSQRYGHPGARPMHQSSIPAARLEEVVVSYLSEGLRGWPPRVGGFPWAELQSVNAANEDRIAAWQSHV